MIEQFELDAVRLSGRMDVAEATATKRGIEVVDFFGKEGLFVSYAEAVSWLVGNDDHLAGMAVCPCLKCVDAYIGSR